MVNKALTEGAVCGLWRAVETRILGPPLLSLSSCRHGRKILHEMSTPPALSEMALYPTSVKILRPHQRRPEHSQLAN
jgi:hypothetical protein